jgi:hypothetical protein
MFLMFCLGFLGGSVWACGVTMFFNRKRRGVMRHDTPEARKALGRPW